MKTMQTITPPHARKDVCFFHIGLPLLLPLPLPLTLSPHSCIPSTLHSIFIFFVVYSLPNRLDLAGTPRDQRKHGKVDIVEPGVYLYFIPFSPFLVSSPLPSPLSLPCLSSLPSCLSDVSEISLAICNCAAIPLASFAPGDSRKD